MRRPPGRPKSIFDDLGIDFDLILALRFHPIFYLFRKSPKSRFYWKNNEKSMIFYSRGLPFLPWFLINFPHSFRMSSKTHYFPSLDRSGAPKNGRIDFFGPFLAPVQFSRCPQNRPKSAKGNQRDEKSDRPPVPFFVLCASLVSLFFKNRSRTPFWSILGPPWLQKHWFLYVFPLHFDHIFLIMFTSFGIA